MRARLADSVQARLGGSVQARLRWVALVVVAVTAAAMVALAAYGVAKSARDVARAEARIASRLWEAAGGDAAPVIALLAGRVEIVAVGAGRAECEADDRVDGEAAYRAADEAVAAAGDIGAWGYRHGSMEPEVWIRVVPDAVQGRGLPVGPGALALLTMVVAVGLPLRGGRRGSAWVAAVFAVALAVTGAVSLRWAEAEQASLSRHHLVQAGRAVQIHVGLTAGDPVATAQIFRIANTAAMPWALSSDLQPPTAPQNAADLQEAADLQRPSDVWTMPRDVVDVLRGVVGEPDGDQGGSAASSPSTIEVRALTHYHLRAGPFTLAMLGCEEASSVGIWIAIAWVVGVVIACLVLRLVPLAADARRLRRTLSAWGFLAPAIVLLGAFTFGPILYSLWISMHDWRLLDAAHTFTGAANYGDLVRDGAWWRSVFNTVAFTLHVPVSMAVALALALLTRRPRRLMRLVRLSLFLPAITSVAAIAVVWKWLLNDRDGLVNQALGALGVDPVMWLTSPGVALVSLMIVATWMVVGYQVVVLQAGLAAIPEAWYDAARVDGAGRLQRFWHITLPGLRHTLFFVLVTSVIGSFQVFGLVYVMTEGGPLGATDVAVYHIYREAWQFLQFGNAAAMSWILFALIFVATWLHFRLLDRRSQGV